MDADGRIVPDPTINVKAIVDAATQRQDDLREMVTSHLKEIMALEASHSAELRKAESERIDAIRAVDQGNVTRASEVAVAQATALNTQVQVSAEALRARVEAERITTAAALVAALEPIQRDVAVLREVQFRQQGEKAGTTETKTDRRASANTVIASCTALASAAGIIIAILVKLH